MKPGDAIAVVGAGPVGLAAMMTAEIAGAGADHRGRHGAVAAQARRELRRDAHGARRRDAEQEILEIARRAGVDVAMEAVGVPATFDLCTRIVRAGGTVANIGVHGAPTTLHLEELWIKNITITTGLVSGSTIPTLLKLARDGRMEAEKLGTHRFALGEIEQAYDVFGAAGEHDALKVVDSGLIAAPLGEELVRFQLRQVGAQGAGELAGVARAGVPEEDDLAGVDLDHLDLLDRVRGAEEPALAVRRRRS